MPDTEYEITLTQEELNDLADMDQDRVKRYGGAADYYNGDQGTQLTDRLKQYLEVGGYKYCENFCVPVVDSMIARLTLTGFDIGTDDQGVKDRARAIWRLNRMDAKANIVHHSAALKGDGFVIVEPGERYPRIQFNRPELIRPVYCDDSAERMTMAVKVWKSTETDAMGRKLETRRMNVYHPDRVEKYSTYATTGGDSAAWTPHKDEDDEMWPVPWVDGQGRPLGVPVFHFRNRWLGGQYGHSELAGVIPQQNRLNKELLDLSSVLDNQGFPIAYATGIDESQADDMKREPGTLWTSKDPDGKFGTLEAANPAGLLSSIEATLQRIAGHSQTPLHLLMVSGDAPSGESLKTAESGLVAKVKDRQVVYGNAWEDANRLALILDGKLTLDDDVSIDATWEDPVSRNEKEQREALEIDQRLGASRETVLAKLGYDPVLEADRTAQEADNIGEALIQNFDAGRVAE